MLGFAVRRNRCGKVPSYGAKAKQEEVHLSNLTQSSYIICDAVPGCPIRHASQGFQDLFGYKSSECLGQGFGAQQVSTALRQSDELKNLAQQVGLSTSEVSDSIQRMAQAADAAAAQGTRLQDGSPTLLLATKKTGELFVCEISWSKNTHPTLGWSYQAGLVRDAGSAGTVSVPRLLAAASKESTYAELKREFADELAPALGMPLSEKLASMSEDMHDVAQDMWKNELLKDTKPGQKSRTEQDNCSIWSRSTASTLASTTSSATHHLGALFARPEDKEAPKTPKGCESFWSAPDSEEFEDCETAEAPTLSRNSSLSETPALFDTVSDPIKHVDRSGLRNMKTAFAIAFAGEGSFTIALKSMGLEEMGSGPSLKVKMGGDARHVFQPSDAKAKAVWQDFCESVSIGDFYNTGRGGTALLEGLELTLPAGEMAFVEQFQGKLGNPIDCLVCVKHVELDDCPYLLAMYSYLPESAILEQEYYKLSSQVDALVYELASEFFYHAPMQRQKNGDNIPPWEH